MARHPIKRIDEGNDYWWLSGTLVSRKTRNKTTKTILGWVRRRNVRLVILSELDGGKEQFLGQLFVSNATLALKRGASAHYPEGEMLEGMGTE